MTNDGCGPYNQLTAQANHLARRARDILEKDDDDMPLIARALLALDGMRINVLAAERMVAATQSVLHTAEAVLAELRDHN